jgi:hypothetical protein
MPANSDGYYYASPTLTPFQPEENAPEYPQVSGVMPVTATDTPNPPSLWVSPGVPDLLRQDILRYGLVMTVSEENANAHIDQVNPGATINQQVDRRITQTTEWIYALVAPFPTITDGVSLADIQQNWAGNPTGEFSGNPFWMEKSTLAAFTAIWGPPAPNAVMIADGDQLLDLAWQDRPSWGIIPFEKLDPRWKVLSVDGQSPIHNDFNSSIYPLKITFGLDTGEYPIVKGNRDPEKLTVLAMTGVTALVRATADRMETKGVLYPGEEIRDTLRQADITHISNEISFDPDCPTPDPWTESLRFCSDPRYIDLLEDIGTDIVELTGNHLLDYGAQNLQSTLDMYDQRGWKYFGGGRNYQAALQPSLIEDHGNNLAFLGCNFAGPPGDWATQDTPGSAPCDFDEISAEIASLKVAGYIPIMTFQYNEYYQPNPTLEEEENFRKIAEAGAVIVSGSQAHMPAIMEIKSGSFIHYGLGNLFFDQMSHLMPDGSLIYDTRNLFVDRHIFYDGKYLGTELLTYIIEDYSRPRLMTDSERTEFLTNIFQVAGW